MDYHEAIEIIEYASAFNSENSRLTKALSIAISAMHELGMYKDSKLCLIPEDVYSKQCNELDEYKQLGTLEEVREAAEKQKAISREIIEGKYFCPKCHNLMPYPGYCGCGQKLY